MTDTAKIINFPDIQETQGATFVKADTKNGFTQLANELLDYLCVVELSGRQYRVFCSLVRKTYGFNKKSDWIVAEQLAEQMKYEGAVTHIHADLRELKSRKIILTDGKKIGPNPILSEWMISKNKPKTVTSKTNRKRSLDKPKTVTRQTENGHNTNQNQSTQKKDIKPKDNINKNNMVAGLSILPNFISKDLWVEFIDMRKRIKKPVTENVAKRMINKLEKFNQSGLDAVQALTQTIDNCWADIYEPKRGFNANHIQATTILPTDYQINDQLPGME